MIENSAIDSMCVMSTQPNSAEQRQQSVDAKVDKLQHNIPKKPKAHGPKVDDNGNKASLCYYHNTFGDRARKCRPDCRYYQQLG
ncbi:GL13177 [Drosophila persimilis]|uniref:GL13177 n=1 Tax=Drosophila persimilis TaxID=7234 RepID=B4IRT9_DROPE|nr:GL13177 [Drosophila persimilis]